MANHNAKRKSDLPGSSSGCMVKRRKVIGPALPQPHHVYGLEDQQRDKITYPPTIDGNDNDNDDNDDDDDSYGPSLPPLGGATATVSSAVEEFQNTVLQKGEPAIYGNKIQRDQWMLQPPKSSDINAKPDPTRLRNRRFQEGKSINSSMRAEVDASWTESPQQRLKRLKDEAMGLASPALLSEKGDHKAKSSRRTVGLVESAPRHDSEPLIPEEPPLAAKCLRPCDLDGSSFEWERDMAKSPSMSISQRRQIMDKATGFASRFAKGKYL